MTDEHDFAVAHFERMAELARQMKAVPALILEAGYSYSSFGSWWFSFQKKGWQYRISFDGREGRVSLESGGRRSGGKAPDWVETTSRTVGARDEGFGAIDIIGLVREAVPVEGSAA